MRRGATIIVAVFFASALFLPAYCYGISASFLYKLSDNNGTIPFDSVKVSADRWHHELYVIDGGDSSVRIFNETGMEVYRINDDGSLGSIADGVVDKEGNFIALAYKGQEYSVIRCNYRGEFLASLALKNIPGAFQAGFYPTALAYREGHLYLADKVSMKVLVTDEEGLFEQGIDLFDVLGFTKNAKKKKGDIDMSGFSVDREGDILFTVPVEFCAYKLSPGGNISSFCQRGGGPGRFNIASGIASDDNGYIYVSDKLKSAVLIFDKDFSFLHQIGHRGIGPGGLIVPMDMAVLGDKLYVTQSAGQGVSVFSIGH